MIENLNKTFSITGASGKEYTFNMYAFDDFDALKKCI